MKSIEADQAFHLPADSADVLCPRALQKLKKIMGGNNALLIELIDIFLEDAPVLLDNIRRAVKGGMAADLQLAAHSLKSSSAEFGASALCDLCRELEAMGRDNTLEGAEKKVSQAEMLYKQVQVALTTVRATLAAEPV